MYFKFDGQWDISNIFLGFVSSARFLLVLFFKYNEYKSYITPFKTVMIIIKKKKI